MSDFPEIPLPDLEVEQPEVKDEFNSSVQFSFLGVGHGGSRVCESIYQLGYRRVCIVNTAIQDLNEIKIPDDRKLCIGVGGAAKDRRNGRQHVEKSYEEIVDLMRRSYGTKMDRVIVIATAAGGTGSGGFETAVQAAEDLLLSLRIQKTGEKTRVGLILILPSNSERSGMRNAFDAIKDVDRLEKAQKISPIIIMDNERILAIFRSATLGNVWEKVNQSITSLFHLFNRVSVMPTKYTAFDPSDYSAILDSGYLTYGALPIKSVSKEDIAFAIRDNLSKNVLTGGMDLKKAKCAACVLIGEESVLDLLPAENVDHAFEMLARVSGDAVIHRGIYSAAKPFSAYTLAGGLHLPKIRVEEIARMAGIKDWDE